MSIDFDSSRKVVRAGYKPVVDETALTRPAEGPVKDIPEKAPGQEVNLKLYCTPDELNTLQTGVWLLGATDNEKAVAQWKKQQTHEGDCILTAQCFEAEEKTLYHDLFLHSGQSDAYTVIPNPTDSQKINAEFIPVKLAVQVSETRLGWPTAGYFYLLSEGKLTKEFKVVGDGRWTFQVTRSDASNLTEELLSEHHYASILLPYKIEGQPAPEQHLLYREEKLTADELADARVDWLNQHAMTLDMDQVVGTKQTPLLERSGEPTPENEAPSPIETLAAVHPYGDTWGRYNQHEIDAQTVNITESKSIKDNVPVLNPTYMYWPPYNFLTGEEIEIKYVGDKTTIALMSISEATEFTVNLVEELGLDVAQFIQDNFDTNNTKSYLTTIKDTYGLYDGLKGAEDTAIALGGLGVTAYVKEINGKDWLILKNFKRHLKTLLKGQKWGASNPQVLKYGIGLLEGQGHLAYLRTTVQLEVILAVGINVIDYLVNDEKTLGDVAGHSTADITKALVSTGIATRIVQVAMSAVIRGAVAAGFVTVSSASIPIVVTLGAVAIVSYAVGQVLDIIDNDYKYTQPMIDSIKEAIDE
ncbi:MULTISPECIES: hypothetical protein [unclassified Vibrio]|uniref:hypothetical protein n=1 Tax=unclassified Vibrio TaxID=2614977 RepID=UPI001360BD84|nr:MULTISPECIES: hypothetical protein [unclassified Vibrio]NAW57305.1 hypothetical protein [Vibrio sp. V36_P2S2PM302]NAX25277.1 hypothetical protein [Vibrio sp. V38_P2S17PM301]NAX29745.1 hypothetical protein [Vibrio sp. V37_P2S8PM304]